MPKNENIRNFILVIISMTVSLLLFAAGLLLSDSISFGFGICVFIVTLLIALIIGNLIWGKSFIKKINDAPVKEQMDSILTRHQNAQTGLESAIHRLKRIQNIVIGYFLVLMILAFALSFFNGTTANDHTVFNLLSIYVIYGILYCLSPAPEIIDEDLYVTEEEFPYLYKIARKAMHDLDITGDIRIMILPDWNAGIAKMNEFYSLQLGAEMLHMLTEDEIYHVLLHEFGHLADPYSREYLTPAILTRLQQNRLDSDMATLTLLLTRGPFYYYSYESDLYDITTSKTMERRADMKACTVGNSSIYASALVKMALREFFDFESNDYLKEPYYEPERPRENVTTLMTTTFAKALTARKDHWLAMLEKQLPPLMDSHPSFNERYASIGRPEYKLVFPFEITNSNESADSDKNTTSEKTAKPTKNELYENAKATDENSVQAHKTIQDKHISYWSDCQKAIKHADKLIFDQLSENYKEEREEHYLKPLQDLEQWQKEGSNINDTNIANIIKALDSLCRYEEAENLCDQIIAESPNVYITAFPLLYKGNRLLHRYDKNGIDLIYRSINLNSNLISTGLDMIGSYCQQMGLEKELNEYRKKVPEYSQKEVDYNDNGGEISKSDHLISEQFPDNRLEEILAFMLKAGNNSIDKIYLVRKVINEESFFSVFIIRWKQDTEESILISGMDKIFNYLDTYPDGWPYSLFLCDDSLEKIVKKVENSLVYPLG